MAVAGRNVRRLVFASIRFLEWWSDVHHQIGTKAHVGGFSGRVAQRVKYRGEGLVCHYFFS